MVAAESTQHPLWNAVDNPAPSAAAHEAGVRASDGGTRRIEHCGRNFTAVCVVCAYPGGIMEEEYYLIASWGPHQPPEVDAMPDANTLTISLQQLR